MFKRVNILRIISLISFLIFAGQAYAQAKLPGLSINLYENEDPDAFVPALKIVSVLTILAVAPAILLMMTSFTRIVIVLSFLRQALGTQQMPPNQVILGLSLFLTLFTMGDVLDKVNDSDDYSYMAKAITQEQAIEEILKPVKKFMPAQTKEAELGMFLKVSKQRNRKQK